MKWRTTLLLAALLAPAPLAAQQAELARVRRSNAGDTIVLRLDLRGDASVHVSEPLYLEGRVRLHVDLNDTRLAADSAAIAGAAGAGLLAITPQARAGGIALAVDLERLAWYDVVRSPGALTLRALAQRPAAEVRLPAPAAARAPRSEARARQPGPVPSLLLLVAFPGGIVLLAVRRRRARSHAPAAEPAVGSVTTSPGERTTAPSGRVWAARTLAASGASAREVARRTGLPREAVQYLRQAAARPAVSAELGSNYRPETRAAFGG